jgi:TRAP-type C4-dicarboxylate transport system permease small subunit
MVNLGFALVAGIFTFALVFVVLYDVTFRYLLAKPITWSMDFGELAMLPIVYMPAALLSQEGGHVQVELFLSTLGRRRRAFADIVSSLGGLCFAVLLEWQAIVTLGVAYREGSLTMIGRVPVYPAVIFFVVGAFALSVQQLVNVFKCMAVFLTPKEENVEKWNGTIA